MFHTERPIITIRLGHDWRLDMRKHWETTWILSVGRLRFIFD